MAQGTPGVFDPRNPTLVPVFDQPSAGSGGLSRFSPADMLGAFPRTDAVTAAIACSGSADGDTVTLTINCKTLPGGSVAVTATLGASDTDTTMTEKLAAAVMANATCRSFGIYPELDPSDAGANDLKLHFEGPVGNFATFALSGDGAEAFSHASGAFTGGSGAIVAMQNFNYASGSSINSFWAGQVYEISYPTLIDMVSQGMPIR